MAHERPSHVADVNSEAEKRLTERKRHREDISLRVMTLNIAKDEGLRPLERHAFCNRQGPIIDLLILREPHILAVQEASFLQAAWLDETLPLKRFGKNFYGREPAPTARRAG